MDKIKPEKLRGEEVLQVKAVRLPFWHIQKAKKLGGGNFSRGVRLALSEAKSKKFNGDDNQ